MKQKPVPLMEVKAAPPNFDLAASSFPPLPGSVVPVQGETVTEVRLSDVVRGLRLTSKVTIPLHNITFTCWRMIAGFRCIIVLCFINLFIKMYFRQETRRTAWLKTQKTLKVLQANRNLPPCLLNPLLLLRHKQQLLQQQGNYAV